MTSLVRNRDPMAAFWMPFTANRKYKAKPKLLAGAKGMYYRTQDGREILDGMAGLWCVNAGHAHPKIVEAIREQAGTLDFVSSFQMSHPGAFAFADRLAAMAPDPLNHVFFTNSGSEAVDTALKIARGYHYVRGEGGRKRLIGRIHGYHGMGWGGLSVGGLARHRREFGPLLPDVDHLSDPYDRTRMAFTKGQPAVGGEQADELLSLIDLHGAASIAAVIVEPMAGSAGVYPPPRGYLERLREICTAHGILLIFDEVITGFGRLGAPFAAERFGVVPDIMTCAKGMTNAAVPMGGVIVSSAVYDAYMHGPEAQIELSHGYTYSAHPLACAAGLATLDVYRSEGLFQRVANLETKWEEAAHALKGTRHIVDIRNFGFAAAFELEPVPNRPGARAAACYDLCYEAGVLVRTAGETVVVSPPLIISEAEIARLFETIAAALAKIP